MSTSGTSISKLEGIDTSRTWSVDGVKIKIGKSDHALFEHEADAHDAIVAHNAVDDTLALIEASKKLASIYSSMPKDMKDSIGENGRWSEFVSAVAKFVP